MKWIHLGLLGCLGSSACVYDVPSPDTITDAETYLAYDTDSGTENDTDTGTSGTDAGTETGTGTDGTTGAGTDSTGEPTTTTAAAEDRPARARRSGRTRR